MMLYTPTLVMMAAYRGNRRRSRNISAENHMCNGTMAAAKHHQQQQRTDASYGLLPADPSCATRSATSVMFSGTGQGQMMARPETAPTPRVQDDVVQATRVARP
jgi:hypothetical protein